MPAVRLFSVIFIEFVRGVPLITVLFMASVMLPLFVPDAWSPDKLLRALVGVALFASAYMAEVVRAGLAGDPEGPVRGRDGGRPRLLADDAADHPAAGAEDHHPEHRQHLSSACSRTRRWSSSSASSISCDHRGGARRSELGDAGDQRHRLCLRRDLLFRSSATACRATRGASKPGSRRATGAEGTRMATATAASPRLKPAPLKTGVAVDIDRRAQVVRRVPRAARHQPRGRRKASAS